MKFNAFTKLVNIAGLISLASFCHAASANEIRVFGAEPNPTELANFLFGESESNEPEKFTSRSMRVLQQEDRPKETAPIGIVPILFEFDSDAIKPEAFGTIESIAQMLATEQAAEKAMLIEGHTDAVGDSLYNKGLSMRRAFSVKNMLVQIFDVDPRRLVVEGKGESELYDENAPNSERNRRVQLKAFEKN